MARTMAPLVALLATSCYGRTFTSTDVARNAPDGSIAARGRPTHVVSCPQGENMCNAACVNEQSDDKNCGGCDLSCPTGCVAGKCIITLASEQNNATAIAVNDAEVYWLEQGLPSTFADGAVMSLPISGGQLTTLASNQHWPTSIALDDHRVYWTTLGTPGFKDGAVLAEPLRGGAITTLAGEQYNPVPVGVGGADVYWHSGGSLLKTTTDADGAAPVTLTWGPQIMTSGIAVNPTSVYWMSAMDLSPVDAGLDSGPSLNRGIILQTWIDGGETTTLTSALPFPAAMATDDTNIYWMELGAAPNYPGAILTIPKVGGAPVTLVSGLSLVGTSAGGIAVDESSVYWVDGGGNGEVMKAPRSGGTPTTLASGESSPVALAVDRTSVYWTTWPHRPPCASDAGPCDSKVRKLTPK